MSRATKLKEEHPELYDDEQIRLFAEQGDQLHAIKSLYDQEGGKVLTNVFLKEIRNRVNQLAAKHKEMSHEEMVGMCAELNAFLQSTRLIRNAKSNLEEADRALEEAIAQ